MDNKIQHSAHPLEMISFTAKMCIAAVLVLAMVMFAMVMGVL